MSDRIVESLNEMKQIYLESVSGMVISERDEYLQYIEEKNKKMKNDDEDEKDNDDDDGDEADADYDEDGKVESGEDEFLGSRHNAIQRAMGRTPDGDPPKRKKKKMDESYSDWRYDLYEKVGDVEADIEDAKQRQIKERSGIVNKVDINPNVNIGESVELTEEYIDQIIDIAAEYFYEQGLNEEGLEMVIEDLGVDKFLEYVFCISEDLILTEARKAKRVPTTPEEKARKIAKIKAGIDDREAAKKMRTVARKVTVSRGNELVKKAVATQPKARPALDALARGIMGAAKTVSTQYQQGMQRHRQAVSGARQTAQTVRKAASTATKAASEIGSGMRAPMETKAGRNVQAALIKGAKRVTKAAVTAAAKETAKRRVGVREEIESFLLEKAESEQQQKIFGLALSVKRGETPRSEVSKQVLEIVDGMSEAKIRKFAKTKHEGLPRKKEG
jgi:hypothetical protein